MGQPASEKNPNIAAEIDHRMVCFLAGGDACVDSAETWPSTMIR
jgi:hypothetical protein